MELGLEPSIVSSLVHFPHGWALLAPLLATEASLQCLYPEYSRSAETQAVEHHGSTSPEPLQPWGGHVMWLTDPGLHSSLTHLGGTTPPPLQVVAGEVGSGLCQRMCPWQVDTLELHLVLKEGTTSPHKLMSSPAGHFKVAF